MTKRSCLLLSVLAAFSLVLAGCQKKYEPPAHAHNPDFEVTLCGFCGDVKADDAHQCKAGAKLCPKCGLHQGTILCCSKAYTGSKGDVVLCTKCGEKTFTLKCCMQGQNKDAAICPKCGLHKGSPGCCKIKRKDGTGEAG
jgi:hypothetical protein